jgi:hypothetical protein
MQATIRRRRRQAVNRRIGKLVRKLRRKGRAA